MTRTSRLLGMRGTSAPCVTVLVTKKRGLVSKNETAAPIRVCAPLSGLTYDARGV